jgi:membrane protein YdbS with pleckstrin-like domain
MVVEAHVAATVRALGLVEAMKLTLIEDAGRVWHKLWSVRLALVTALLSAAQAGWDAYTTGNSPIMAWVTFAIAVLTAVSRLVAQPSVTGNGSEE